VTVAAIDALALRIQQLNPAEASVHRFAEEQLELTGRLIKLATRRRISSVEIRVCQGRGRQQRKQRRRREAEANTSPRRVHSPRGSLA
jgi:hypothetical protein